MIIKGLFRRYERWNPVHPTSGAFWGMGIGLGCGVGWGPGFGPEAIGYVGAGCGVGFSVGITLIGIGVGLPANSLIAAPYTALMATQNGLVELVRLCGSSQRSPAINDQNRLSTCISSLRNEAYKWLANFHNQGSFEDDIGDSANTRTVVVSMNNNRSRVGKAND